MICFLEENYDSEKVFSEYRILTEYWLNIDRILTEYWQNIFIHLLSNCRHLVEIKQDPKGKKRLYFKVRMEDDDTKFGLKIRIVIGLIILKTTFLRGIAKTLLKKNIDRT